MRNGSAPMISFRAVKVSSNQDVELSFRRQILTGNAAAFPVLECHNTPSQLRAPDLAFRMTVATSAHVRTEERVRSPFARIFSHFRPSSDLRTGIGPCKVSVRF